MFLLHTQNVILLTVIGLLGIGFYGLSAQLADAVYRSGRCKYPGSILAGGGDPRLDPTLFL